MRELNFKLPFSTLIPDFIYQFLSTEYIERNFSTCFELEDLREVIIHNDMKGIDEIKNFLMIEEQNIEGKIKLEADEHNLDYELAEIDDEYYHRYTPEELRFIFAEIINNIDELYDAFFNFFGMNMTFTIGFKTKENIEMNMVIEFLSTDKEPEFIKEAFYIGINNKKVSDNIIAFLYFVGDDNEECQKFLNNIINSIEFKEE